MTSAAVRNRAAGGPPPVYDIRAGTISADRPLDDPAWSAAAVARVVNVRPESTRIDLSAEVRLLFDGDGLHGRFDVDDAGVRCVHEGFGAEVWKDSCVELFVEPHPGRGYMNFEFNAGGAWLASHIMDPVRIAPGRFRDYRRLVPREVAGARVVASLPPRIEPPLLEPTRWRLCFFLPWSVLVIADARVPRTGDRWRGNFYLCGDETPWPHWVAWAAVDELNFHLPRCFGDLRFCGLAF